MTHTSVASSLTFQNAVAGEHSLEREIILKCARTHIDAWTADRLKDLLQKRPDWTYLHRTAATQGVAALLYLSLRNTHPDLVPEAALQQLRAHFHSSGLAVHVLVREFAELSKLLSENGIDVLLVKGPALAVAAYGGLAHRKPGDLDLLVAKEDFEAVTQILKERGYSINGAYQDGLDFSAISDHIKTKKGVTFFNRGWTVDLHWTLDDYPIATNLNMDAIWARRKEVSMLDFSTMTLSPEDNILFLACHGAKHNWGRVSMICDMAELLRSHPDLDWQYVLRNAGEANRERMLRLGLALAAGLLDAELPEHIEQEVERDRSARFVARRVGAALFNSPSSTQVHLVRLMVLGSAGEKMAYLAHRWARTH